jgi:hypothetical protein
MKRFLIDTSVENAEGTQTWFVDAETEEEAIDKFSDGGCDLYESNVDVTRCGEPEISGEVPLDDFGRFAAQPAQPAPVQEPVGTYGEIYESMQSLLRSGLQRDQQIYMAMKDKPLYTIPPAAQRERVGLTDEEKQEWVEAMPDEPKPRHIMNLINVIEAKLKEKNNG